MDGNSAFFLGLFIGVAIGWFIGANLRRKPIAAPFVECPSCTQPIKPTAAVCHHCHSKVEAA
jgi:prepilin signal peptidase PulO-like enzyme (type II secretory pathway)